MLRQDAVGIPVSANTTRNDIIRDAALASPNPSVAQSAACVGHDGACAGGLASIFGGGWLATTKLGQATLAFFGLASRVQNAADGLPPAGGLAGGLAAHEAAGGHLLARHVGKTEAELAARLAAQPRITAASSFATRAEAEVAASGALQARAADVNAWVAAGASNRLVIDAAYKGGSVVVRGAAGATEGTGVRFVLQGSGNGTWHILTGFPTP